jgi:hypothetical protein
MRCVFLTTMLHTAYSPTVRFDYQTVTVRDPRHAGKPVQCSYRLIPLYASYRHKSIDLSLLKRLECCALSVSRRNKGAGEFLRDQEFLFLGSCERELVLELILLFLLFAFILLYFYLICGLCFGFGFGFRLVFSALCNSSLAGCLVSCLPLVKMHGIMKGGSPSETLFQA